MDPVTKLIHLQPFRTLYIILKFVTIVVKLPFWAIFHLTAIDRPRGSWTLKKTVLVKSFRELGGTSMRTGQFFGRDHTKEVMAKHCLDARFLWIDQVPSNLIVGEIQKLAQACGAESVRIPGYGFGKWGLGGDVPLAQDGERVFMNLHGGAYVIGTAHPEDFTANIPRGLVEYGASVIARVLSVDYRLSASDPYPTAAPYPTSLLDALAGYIYLTRMLGFKPQNVFISGDSAGGNLAQALVRYLRDNPQLGLGLPGGVVLFSPWSDPTWTHRGLPNNQGKQNINSDYLRFQMEPKRISQYAVRSLLGRISPEVASKDPYISPASLKLDPRTVNGMFTGFPPTYVVSGGGELPIDEIRTLSQRMKADMGDQLVYDEVTDAPHDFCIFTAWEPERSETMKRIIDWVQRV